MERRRKLLFALAIGVAPILVGIACSFPDVEFALTEAGVIGPPLGPDANGGADDAGVSEGSTVDVAVRDEDAGIIDPAVCKTRPLCDCDEDGYLAVGCDAGPDSGGKLSGDCDDLDPFRHPDQIFTTERPKDGGWDWNCDGTEEKAYKENPTCIGGGLSACGGEGFKQTVACGATGEFYTCVKDGFGGLGCSLSSYVGPRQQPCK